MPLQHFNVNNIFVFVFFTVTGISPSNAINPQNVLAPNVTLDPSTNSVINVTNQTNLQSQTSVASSIHQTIVTASSAVLTSTTSTFPLPTHSAPNTDMSSNVSFAKCLMVWS